MRMEGSAFESSGVRRSTLSLGPMWSVKRSDGKPLAATAWLGLGLGLGLEAELESADTGEMAGEMEWLGDFFDEDGTGRITLRNMRRISRELGENLSDEP